MPKVSTVTLSSVLDAREVTLPDFDKQYLDDVSFVTAMTLVMMGNYCQTGHFGGPLAYTPYTVASHLIGPELGGLKYDYRRPKHPYSDKFMLAGGQNARLRNRPASGSSGRTIDLCHRNRRLPGNTYRRTGATDFRESSHSGSRTRRRQ